MQQRQRTSKCLLLPSLWFRVHYEVQLRGSPGKTAQGRREKCFASVNFDKLSSIVEMLLSTFIFLQGTHQMQNV